MPPSKGIPSDRSVTEADSSTTAVSKEGTPAKKPVHLFIDGEWIDLTSWQDTHPGGPTILQHLHESDATDVFHALHSKEAFERLKKLPRVPKEKEPRKPHLASETDIAFRKLRQDLEKEGFWERSIFWEAFYIILSLAFAVVGFMVATTHPWIATALVGLSLQQAAFIGHDYCHLRGSNAFFMCMLIGPFVGLSRSWWSQKHNAHHAFPNHKPIDKDIRMEPVFFIFRPTPETDTFLRKYQHLYFYPVLFILFVNWRRQSLKYAWDHGKWDELFAIVSFMVYFFCLPWKVAIGSILLGGFLMGIYVTATHQGEDLYDHVHDGESYSFVKSQFNTTRNAYSPNPFINYMWGGMQFQLEHHLFPTMPRYHFQRLRPRLQAWAKKHGLEYREDGSWEIFARNYRTMRACAATKSKPE